MLSEEALMIHESFRSDIKSVRDDILDVRKDVSGVSEAVARFTQNQLAEVRANAVFREQMLESTRRMEARLTMNDERVSSLVRASVRDHDILASLADHVATLIEQDVDRARPWYLRQTTWRPVIVSTVFAVFASVLTACATLGVLGAHQ
jgi:hypothetical protein